MRIEAIVTSPFVGAGIGVIVIVWESFWLLGPPIGVALSIPSSERHQYVVGGFAALCVCAFQACWALRARNLALTREVADLKRQVLLNRPLFMPVSYGIQHVEMDSSIPAGTQLPYRFMIVIAMTIESQRRPAFHVVGRQIVTKTSLLEPPMINAPIDNGYNVSRDFNIKSPIRVPENASPCFIALELRYKDSETGAEYHQDWYWRWAGSQNGLFHSDFGNLTSKETDRFVAYLKDMPEGWGPL